MDDDNFYDSYRPDPDSRPQRQAPRRENRTGTRVQRARVAKPSLHTALGGIAPRKSSYESNGNTQTTRGRPNPKHVPEPLILNQEDRPQFRTYQHAHTNYDEPTQEPIHEPEYNTNQTTCQDIHHQHHEASHLARLNDLSTLPHHHRLTRAQKIFLSDPSARPILALGLPIWHSRTLRNHLYASSLKTHTSKIHSPRTRTRFLDWQSEIDDQTHHCWHGIDTYDLNPVVRQARQELSSGPPARVMPYRTNGLRLLQRRPTLDILTPAEQQQLINWWEDHHGRRVLTPTQRKFPWLRIGERHYLQRRAKQAEKDKNQRLYDMGLLSPGTAATLREHGKLHGDYRGRRRAGSLSLRREPTQESKMTVRTW